MNDQFVERPSAIKAMQRFCDSREMLSSRMQVAKGKQPQGGLQYRSNNGDWTIFYDSVTPDMYLDVDEEGHLQKKLIPIISFY